MARVRGTEHERTRERILATARSLAVKDGHERLSLRAVARRAGFSPASLYEYFRSKDEIVGELAARAGAELGERLLAAALNASDAAQRLVDLGLAYQAYARERQEDFLLFFSRLPSTRRALSRTGPAASPYGVLVDAVVRAQENGHIPPGDPEPIAFSVWAMAHGSAMLQLTHLRGFEADFGPRDRDTLEALVIGWGVKSS